MVVPFGFSAGDLIEATELVGKVITSLKDSEGASSSYQQVIIELNGLKKTLGHLQSLEPNEHNVVHVNTIRFMASACMLPLQSFLDSVQKYEKSLVPGSSQRSGLSDARKAQWGVFMEKEVAKMRTVITAQATSINLLLGVHQTYVR